MNFEEFCNYVKESIYEYLPEDHQDCRIVMHDVNKTNIGKLRAFSMIIPGSVGGPTQYMEPFFDAYKHGIPLDEIMSVMAERQIENESMESRILEDAIEELSDFEAAKEHIIICAVGYEKNHEMLSRYPIKSWVT